MELTFSPLPLAVGGRGDSFTFMVEDFDLDGGAVHHSVSSPNRDTTVPSSPMGQQIGTSGIMVNSAGSLKMPVSIGRRNSFDWAANGSGRHRSLSFEFFNMDASSAGTSASMMSGGPHHHHMNNNYTSMMSPEDALLMQAQTPKGMSALKRKHIPFSSQHFIGGGPNNNYSGLNGSNQYHAMGIGSLYAEPRSKKQKKERKQRAPKLNADGSIKEKKKKSKKLRGPRKTRTKKNEEPVEIFDPSIPRIGIYTLPQREEKIKKWMEKARRRVWDKKIKYGCRKRLADARPRYKGRFVKSLPEEKLSIQKLDDDAVKRIIDPELVRAQEATRIWKLRQAATAAAAKIAAANGTTVVPIGAVVVPVVNATATVTALTKELPGTPPAVVSYASSSSSSSSAVVNHVSSEADGYNPQSPVTVTVTKQIPSSVSNSKIDFAELKTDAMANHFIQDSII